ncbi:hypothetical protein FLAVO9R_20106 [Flavobacterium sp. 9R]|nr:hypothetical protein FLAVO9R_20106 [Flavobacterium sp. 9R]
MKFNWKRNKDVSQVRKEKLKCSYMPYMVFKKNRRLVDLKFSVF